MKTFKFFALYLGIFSYSLTGFAKTIVISDIDDTIKKANSMGGIGGLYHFLRKKPYAEARDLFNEIKNYEKSLGDDVSYYYVSAAPSFTFDGDEWIRKNNFPSGLVILKTKENGGDTYDYKYRTIKAIILSEEAKNPGIKILFFGDNSQHDAKVYFDLRKDLALSDSKIFIRDVSTEGTYFADNLPVKKLDKVDYFFSERELVDNSYFFFMSDKLKQLIQIQYQNKAIIPPYTFDTLIDRLKEICQAKFIKLYEDDKRGCKAEAKNQAAIYWADYFRRF